MPLTRFFNRVEITDKSVRKASTDREKIIREFRYFHLLPADLRRSFVEPYDLKDNGEEASYSMERIHAPDLASEWTSGILRGERFRDFLASVSEFLRERPRRPVGPEGARSVAYEAYIAKTRRRVSAFLSTGTGQSTDSRLRRSGVEGGLEAILRSLEERYSDAGVHGGISGGFVSLSHGDLCLSNCFLTGKGPSPTIRLIDPRGASTRDELFGDHLYDFVKLSHSILGNYDFIVRGAYDIHYRGGASPAIFLHDELSESLTTERKLFASMCEEHDVAVDSLRIYEAALFLSMLPLHSEDLNRVTAFALNAHNLLR